MANVLVVGAHGHVGKLIVAKLAKAGEQVFAGFRSEAQFQTVANIANVTPVEFDLTAAPEAMAQVYSTHHIDTVVFSAGSGGSTGDDMTLLIDLDGAVKTMDAAKQAGVQRYVMVSAAGADDRSFWPKSGLHTYYVAKHYADRILKASALDYTIVRPTLLTNDAGTGKIAVNGARLGGSIPRDDVASTVVAVLKDPNTARKIYQITSGDDAIDAALRVE
ncbi:SDR family oxidoreductase [Nicoliella spurrieriana]|uniref:SDR family oxidoreductase n=1 Tax=Nicoliella spurrieriana TaxID=2925830 RepID=A0A976RT57_9LACO|nr:SDR family oxidoreductase [Nicoliella spurrieriana]UQS87408.1 SDR family oxidoreductase [Nicoliella spurrieriana]